MEMCQENCGKDSQQSLQRTSPGLPGGRSRGRGRGRHNYLPGESSHSKNRITSACPVGKEKQVAACGQAAPRYEQCYRVQTVPMSVIYIIIFLIHSLNKP